MARIADPDKVENLKKAVMECVIEDGYAGVSTASICKKAKVSPGYLYRFYESKDELISELVDTEIKSIMDDLSNFIDTSKTVYEAAYRIVYKLLMSANEDHLKAQFTACVVLSIMVQSNDNSEMLSETLNIARHGIELGIKTGEIKEGTDPLDVLIVAFTVPFRYVQFSYKYEVNKIFTVKEAEHVAKLCVTAFR